MCPLPTLDRDCHGYGKTRGFEVMGFAGTGTVVNFGTPHTRTTVSQVFHGYITTR
jgi:hypothetical protein